MEIAPGLPVTLKPITHKLKNRIREHGETWQVKMVGSHVRDDMILIESLDRSRYLMWVEKDAIVFPVRKGYGYKEKRRAPTRSATRPS